MYNPTEEIQFFTSSCISEDKGEQSWWEAGAIFLQPASQGATWELFEDSRFMAAPQTVPIIVGKYLTK